MSIKVDTDKCTKCGVCVERCPLDCLRTADDGVPFMQYNDCWYCGVCEYECPCKAITVELPYLVR